MKDWHLVDLHSDHALELNIRALQRDLVGHRNERSGGRLAFAGLEHDAFADEITSWDPHSERKARVDRVPVRMGGPENPHAADATEEFEHLEAFLAAGSKTFHHLENPPEIVYRLCQSLV